jgi:hypothetical protein
MTIADQFHEKIKAGASFEDGLEWAATADPMRDFYEEAPGVFIVTFTDDSFVGLEITETKSCPDCEARGRHMDPRERAEHTERQREAMRRLMSKRA